MKLSKPVQNLLNYKKRQLDELIKDFEEYKSQFTEEEWEEEKESSYVCMCEYNIKAQKKEIGWFAEEHRGYEKEEHKKQFGNLF